MNYKAAYEICLKKAEIYQNEFIGEPPSVTEGIGKRYVSGSNNFVESFYAWTNSHFIGISIIAAHTEKNFKALRWANSFAPYYEAKINRVPVMTMHDVGFLYMHYSVHLYLLTGDRHHRDTALRAADELVKRFDVNLKAIDAWSEAFSEEKDNRIIIDSMMNVILLFWAWKENGYTFYRDIAEAHVKTLIKVLVRDDFSVCHAYFFDPVTGKATEEANTCGFSNGSHWARGTAWMVFGLAAAYAYTKNEDYYEWAIKIGKKFVEELKEDDFIPVWDFRLPADMPARACRSKKSEAPWDESDPANKIYNRDSSAAAIMSCAFMILNNEKVTPFLTEMADKMLQSLCDNYLNTDVESQLMLNRSNGGNYSSIYGDYYFMLALAMKVYGFDIWNLK